MWRWEKQRTLSVNNQSPEVRIERAIVRLLDDNWANQVPAASGLTNANDKRCAVDLIRRHSAVEFDFIELKALRPHQRSSGHHAPLAAAMELLKYTLIFRYCRENRTTLYPEAIPARPILQAETVHLEVLATSNCYRSSDRAEPFRIAWLHHLIAGGLTELNRQPDASSFFDFAFTQFPANFIWTDADHHQLLTCKPNTDCRTALQAKIEAALTNRERVALNH